MDQRQFVDLVRGRYLAQILEDFEEHVEPLMKRLAEPDLSVSQRAMLTQDLGEAFDSFKRTVRRKIGAFAKDCKTAMDLSPLNISINAEAIDQLDALRERQEGAL